MTNPQTNSLGERNVEQAIAAIQKGSYLLKYGRRGKPKFCPFRLSDDETKLIWYVGKDEKQLQLNQVTRIIPGQRTAIFQRYPRPEKEYQSFSLIYGKRSLDVICKDKDEAEVWFIGLRALISQGNCQTWKSESRNESTSSDSSTAVTQRNCQSFASSSSSDVLNEDQRKYQNAPFPFASPPQKRLGRALSDFLLYSEAVTASPQRDSETNSFRSSSYAKLDILNGWNSADTCRTSFASAISSSSQGSCHEDLDSLCDVFIWGEGIGDGLLGGGIDRVGKPSVARIDAYLPKALESSMALDAKRVACGKRHAVLVTKQGEIFSWGEGSGGKLGHGVGANLSKPKLIESLSGLNIESVACGEYHTCAVTLAGHLYAWGDGIHNFGLLGHGTKVSHWTPKRVTIPMEGARVLFVSCGPWHSAIVTSGGQLFTFGDGTFGALGHGSRESTSIPREIETLKGLRTLRVSCGFWHSAAVVDVHSQPPNSGSSLSGKLFSWGSGDQGQLGHGDKDSRLVPCSIAAMEETSFSQVACGHSLTVALSTSGQVYTMGNDNYGQLGGPGSCGELPTHVQGKIKNSVIEEIACGSHHVAVLSSKSELYTWGRGENGQLGHGDNHHRNSPTLVEALKDKRVKSVVCGNNVTAAICVRKQVSIADHSICSGCRSSFNFRLKRHNCYNCGLVFCKACSSKKSYKASLAPNMDKPYRVCDDCFFKLNKDSGSGLNCLPPKVCNGSLPRSSFEEKVSSGTKPRGILSRLSSLDSFRRSDSRLSRKNLKLDSNTGHVYPICDRDNQRLMSFTVSPTSSPLNYVDKMSISLPGSTIHSGSASPLSVKSSPSHSMSFTSAFAALAYPEVTTDESNQSTDALTKEISILREQVDVLAYKSQFLEAELKRTSRQLKETTKLARKEAEKNGAAKEVIKSLMMQLKDVAVRSPPGTSLCRKSDPVC